MMRRLDLAVVLRFVALFAVLGACLVGAAFAVWLAASVLQVLLS